PNRFYLYGVVGQLAALAASDELNAAQAEAPSALEFV
ncbi:glutamate--cysteine ligase, partial [Escherichia coli]|nr:glutamate--cysteine ligase [Escherichia coli]